ncbi:MAG: SAM-dependent methyltransferase [Paludibacteraceae bacterium]|nr:SAM-dependent methyltransferase [Paludibacteraceae bacterium]
MASLYLIPTTLGDNNFSRVLPQHTLDVLRSVKYLIVENVRTTRRYLKAVDKDIDIDGLTFYTLNRHTDPAVIASYLSPLAQGEDMAVISEAGCPAIADPGADVVAIAQQKGIKVVPLVGPSSILLALMASGFNGQSFAFNGYLPIDNVQRQKAIKHFENRARTEQQSQIFIETPYRNNALRDAMLTTLAPQTRLAIATDITLPTESISAKTVMQWRKGQMEDINHRPSIFIIY